MDSQSVVSVSSVLDKPENSKIQKQQDKMEKCAEKLLPQSMAPRRDLCENIQDYVKKLNDLLNCSENTEGSFSKFTCDVLCALADDDNPFKTLPWDTSKNIFFEILDFGIKHNPYLIKLITELSRSYIGLTGKTIFKVA